MERGKSASDVSFPDVEMVLGRVLHHVLVAADPAGLEGLGGELLKLAGHQVHAQRELISHMK